MRHVDKGRLARRMALGSAVGIAFVQLAIAAAGAPAGGPPIPYVPTRHDVVKDMLWLANVGQDDVVYDLGSGDGRILIAAVRDFGARKAVGVEQDAKLVRESREAIEKAGLAPRVEVVEGDLFAHDCSEASVVILYLGHRPNIELRAKLCQMLKPGARVVAHQFGMGEWPPDKFLRVRTPYLGMYGVMANLFASNPRVPDYGDRFEHATHSTVRVWIVPERVAGVWRGPLATADGEREFELVLHQRIGEVVGSGRVGDGVARGNNLLADLWGNHLRLAGAPAGTEGKSYFESQIMFDGHLQGDALAGNIVTFPGRERREIAWEGKRERPRLGGVWEWPFFADERKVQLQVEERDGQLHASYTDREKTVPVSDIYNFGGGFYFTHLIGRQESGGIEITPATGWLIGEGVVVGDSLQGTIEFHPYLAAAGPEGQPGSKEKAGPQPWRAGRVKP